MDDLGLLSEDEADGPPEWERGEWFVGRVEKEDLSHRRPSIGFCVASADALVRASHRGPSIVSGTCEPAMRTSPGVNGPQISVAREKADRYPINPHKLFRSNATRCLYHGW
ncbi:hypothetical protein Acsp03_50790 [Actinomadura sp. NBRC 104412]|nr:hypothetical protein Acsp03_50790 [Actinomadura sp. NBRC 104412]